MKNDINIYLQTMSVLFICFLNAFV